MNRLHGAPLSDKLLFTSYLIVMGLGYLMALVYLYTSHEWHDKQPGLSIEDIAENYYGNRSGTRLEAALRGPMAGFIDKPDRAEVVVWLRDGAPRAEYDSRVRPILEKTCLRCHSPNLQPNIPDLTSYDGVKAVAQVDTGESLHSLMRLSHIHLFGISLLLFALGLVFRLADLPTSLKATVIVLPFVAMLADISGWFVTKWDPDYAYVIFVSGGVLSAAVAFQILVALYQIWLPWPFSRSGNSMRHGGQAQDPAADS